MRKIKFRGKSVHDDRWIFGDTFFISNSGNAYVIPISEQLSYYGGKLTLQKVRENYKVYTNSVGQYIGLNDKNDVEIYEGDIVIVNIYDGFQKVCKVCEVIFKNCTFTFRCKYNNIYLYFPIYLDLTEVDDFSIRIVGNVFENPEILTYDCKDIYKDYMIINLNNKENVR